MTQFPIMNKAARTRLEIARDTGVDIIVIDEAIYPSQDTFFYKPLQPWVFPGRYEVIREFDEDRLIIRLTQRSITLVDKSLTRKLA